MLLHLLIAYYSKATLMLRLLICFTVLLLSACAGLSPSSSSSTDGAAREQASPPTPTEKRHTGSQLSAADKAGESNKARAELKPAPVSVIGESVNETPKTRSSLEPQVSITHDKKSTDNSETAVNADQDQALGPVSRSIFDPIDFGSHSLSADDEKLSETPSLSRYLDSFFYGDSQNKRTESASTGRDFSSYGFITPTHSLEELVNKELESLRPKEVPEGKSDLFDRIRAGFRLDLSSDDPRLAQQLAWYASNPNYLYRTFSRAARYLRHIVDELEAADMPLELALLPLVESAYDPFAYSHGRASGLWQFIPGTGRIYGLNQTWWYDGRRDVLASTNAAIQYLKYLNKRFDGDWLHALAAYNSGSGRVGKAIRKNRKKGKATDFWSLKLPRETRAYVPKLLAIAKIVAHPEKYGVKLNPIPDTPYFEAVEIAAQMDLAHAASLAEIDIEELYRLNPGFNQWATDPLGPHRLLIPADKAQIFREAVSKLDPKERITWERYTVKSGDSLIKIAKRYQTTPALIQQVNKLRSHMIRINQKLLIPVASKNHQFYQLSESNRLAKKQSRFRGKNGSVKIVHRVQTGDTFWDLARTHKVSTRAIAKWNGMAPNDVLRPGQQLVIWSRADLNSALPEAAGLPEIGQRDMTKRIGYRVRKGDSLARIASKFSVTIKEIIHWNKLDRQKYLQPGQKLTIYVDITNG